jgi:hypothetical protein
MEHKGTSQEGSVWAQGTAHSNGETSDLSTQNRVVRMTHLVRAITDRRAIIHDDKNTFFLEKRLIILSDIYFSLCITKCILMMIYTKQNIVNGLHMQNALYE